MKWRYKVIGEHTHVNVYVNGAFCGKLCFRNHEFNHIRNTFPQLVVINEDLSDEND